MMRVSPGLRAERSRAEAEDEPVARVARSWWAAAGRVVDHASRRWRRLRGPGGSVCQGSWVEGVACPGGRVERASWAGAGVKFAGRGLGDFPVQPRGPNRTARMASADRFNGLLAPA